MHNIILIILSLIQNDIIGTNIEPDFHQAKQYNEYKKEWHLHDVLAHCPDKPSLSKFADNVITWAHEGTHSVNAHNSVYDKQEAIYVLSGRFIKFKQPDVHIERIKELVPNNHYTFKTYFIDLPEINRQNKINAGVDGKVKPGYLFDEQSAYINGAITGRQYKHPELNSEIENAYVFTLYTGYVLYYCDLHNIEQDPQMRLLYKYQFSRLNELCPDEKFRKILREDKIGKYLDKIIDISEK